MYRVHKVISQLYSFDADTVLSNNLTYPNHKVISILLISFISWVNKIHEIKCQRTYLFPIHLAGFIENPRN